MRPRVRKPSTWCSESKPKQTTPLHCQAQCLLGGPHLSATAKGQHPRSRPGLRPVPPGRTGYRWSWNPPRRRPTLQHPGTTGSLRGAVRPRGQRPRGLRHPGRPPRRVRRRRSPNRITNSAGQHMIKVPPWQCASSAPCASSGRAWRLLAARHSPEEASPLWRAATASGPHSHCLTGPRTSRLQSRPFPRL